MSKRNRLRSLMGITPNDCLLLFSGKLIVRNDPLIILSTAAGLKATIMQRTHFTIVALTSGVPTWF